MPDIQVVFTRVGQSAQVDLDQPRPHVDSEGTPERSGESTPSGSASQHS